MSHRRSTPTAPGSEDFASSPPSSRQLGVSTATGSSTLDSEELTSLERWALGRSEASFTTLAGAAGGFTSGVVTCPLDVIKTKLQGQGGLRSNRPAGPNSVVYSGMLGTARVIWREEGLRGMYRGLGPIILGYLPTWAVWFTVYGKSKVFFQQYNDNPNLVSFWSSIVAGGSSTMVTNPIWVIKTRLMLQVSRNASSDMRPPWYYRSTLDAARKMYQTEGILSFYSGLTPALLGLTHVAVQFPAYEYLKRKFTGQGMGGSEGDKSFHFGGTFAASVLSKIMASSATYPHEVIRTRLQTQQRLVPSSTSEYVAFRGGLEGSEHQHGPSPIAKVKEILPKYRGIVMTFKTILKEEGWRAFYAGMGTNMMRAVPAATTTIITYEFVMKNLHQTKARAEQKVTCL